MGNPPTPVKLALESICLLLGENAPDWKAIRSVIVRENFINTIVNFSTDDIRYVECCCIRLITASFRVILCGCVKCIGT